MSDPEAEEERIAAVASWCRWEPGENLFDYLERLAVEAGLIPVTKDLRERNCLRYAAVMPKEGQSPSPPVAARPSTGDSPAGGGEDLPRASTRLAVPSRADERAAGPSILPMSPAPQRSSAKTGAEAASKPTSNRDMPHEHDYDNSGFCWECGGQRPAWIVQPAPVQRPPQNTPPADDEEEWL